MDEQVTIGLERYNNLIGQSAKLQSLKDSGYAVHSFAGAVEITYMLNKDAAFEIIKNERDACDKALSGSECQSS